MPHLARPDIELYYETGGSGPPLLMIAGMTSDSASWLPALRPLERRFTVIRPDNRATGRTRPIDAATSVEAMADDCTALLDHLGHARAHLLGHSMGGLVALRLARQDPGRIGALVLAASVPRRLERNVALFDALCRLREAGGPPDLWLRSFFPWLFHPRLFDRPGLVEATLAAALTYAHAQPAHAMRRQLEALRAYDPAPLAGPLPVPALALLGGADLLVPPDFAETALASLPGIATETLPEAGHSLHWDAPKDFAARVAAFLEAHPLAGA